MFIAPGRLRLARSLGAQCAWWSNSHPAPHGAAKESGAAGYKHFAPLEQRGWENYLGLRGLGPHPTLSQRERALPVAMLPTLSQPLPEGEEKKLPLLTRYFSLYNSGSCLRRFSSFGRSL